VFVCNCIYRNIVLVVFFGLFFVPVPTNNLWWREAGNTSHTVLFFILSFLIYQRLRPRLRYSNNILIYFIVFVIGMSLGALIEVLQNFTHRESSLNDVFRDFYGITAGLCLIAAINLKDFNHHRLTMVIFLLVAASCLFIGVRPIIKLSWHYIERNNAFPVIVAFDKDWSSSFISLNNAEIIKTSNLNKNSDDLPLVQFNHGKYPGVSVIETEPDWSGYKKLVLRIISMEAHNVHLVLRIQDMDHNQDYADRFNKKLLVMPGLNVLEIALSEIQHGPVNRQLDLKNVAGLILFSSDEADQFKLKLSNIYLE